MEDKSDQHRNCRGSEDTVAEAFDRSQSMRELINDIKESEADITTCRVKPLDQAFADMRRKLGWNGPSS